MKKIVLLGLVALATAVLLPSVAGAEPGPPCADIVDGSLFYGTDGTVQVSLDLGAPACAFVTYSVTVDTNDGPVQADLVTDHPAADADTLIFEASVDETENTTVCISATTSVADGRHVFDTAPDEIDCVTVSLGGSGATSFR